MTNERNLNIPADYFSSAESRDYVGRQWQRLCSELDAAEQHVRILQAQVQGFSPEPTAPPTIEPRVFRGNGPDCLGCGKTLPEHLTNYHFCPGLPVNRSAEGI